MNAASLRANIVRSVSQAEEPLGSTADTPMALVRNMVNSRRRRSEFIERDAG